MKLGNSLGNRVMALVLCVIMVLGMIPANAIALEGDAAPLGAVVKLTPNGEEVTPEQTGEEVIMTFFGEFTKVSADKSIGRDQDGWWAGIRVKAPEGISLADAKYKRAKAENWSDFSSKEIADNYIDLWCLINEELLENAIDQNKDITYSWNFDWNNNGESDQTVILKVLADEVVLMDLDGEKTVYPICGAVTKLTPEGQEIEPVNAAKKITMTFSGELLKVPADEEIGRNQAGWWVGVRVKAPDGVDLANAKYKRTKATEWTAVTEDEIANGYVDLWCLVDENVLGYAKEDGMVRYSWEFDWDGNGLYAQDVVVEIDANKIVLKDGETTTYPQYGSVVKLTPNGEEVDPVQFGQSIAMVFDKEELVKVDADTTIGRDNEGWWVGVRVKAPENAVLANAKYKRRNAAEWINFNENNQGYVDLWCLVTPELLSKAKDNGMISYSWVFAWFGENADKQEVIVQIDASQIVLKNQDGSIAYPVYGAASELNAQGKEINQNEAAAALTVNYVGEAGKLDKMPIDKTIGRTEEGWWAGIRVKAPEGVDLKKAVYKRTKATEWTDLTETQKADGYVDLWCMVKPEYFVDDEGNAKDSIQYNWDFAWFGANAYTQKVVLKISADAVKLYDGENMVYPYPATISNVQAYVDSDGNTQVIFDYNAYHGVKSITVADETQKFTADSQEKYQVALEGAMEKVSIEIVDNFDNVTTVEDVDVQPQLKVSLTASKEVNEVNGKYYYNEDNKPVFTVQVENFDDDKYAVSEAILTIEGKEETITLTDGTGTYTYDGQDADLTDISVAVKDATGRKASASLDGTYVYDTKAPEVTVTPSTNVTGYYTTTDNKTYVILEEPVKLFKNATQTVSFEVTVTDDNLNAELYEGWEINGNTATKTFAVSVPKHEDKEINLNFTAIDLANNKAADVTVPSGSETTYTLKQDEGVFNGAILIDRTAPHTGMVDQIPTVEVYTDEGVSVDDIFNQDFKFYLDIKDNGSGIKSVIYNLEDASGAVAQIAGAPTVETDNARYAVSVDIADNTESDRVWLTVVITDNVGNSYQFSKNFSVDNKAPVIELVEGAVNEGNKNAYYQNGATFLFAVSDLSLNYEKNPLEWQLDDGFGGEFLELRTDKEYAYITIVDGAVNETTATLTVTATDIHGRQTSKSIQFVVDNKAPEVTVIADSASYKQTVGKVDYFNGEVKYDIQVSDTYMDTENLELSAYVQYEDNTEEIIFNGDNGNYTADFTVTNGKVLKNIQIFAKDDTGNIAKVAETKVSEGSEYALSFNSKNDVLNMSSNAVVVDMTAPVVKVETVADDPIKSVNGVDYFDNEVKYIITVEDQFLDSAEGATISATAIFENGDTKAVTLNCSTQADQLADDDIWSGEFTVENGQVLTDIQLIVLDKAKHEAEQVDVSETAGKTAFDDYLDDNTGAWKYSGNCTVVDMTAPEVTVVTNTKDYIQTVGEVDYFNNEVEYQIVVSDQFMEEGTYDLEVKAYFEGEDEPVVLEWERFDENEEQDLVGDLDTFTSSFKVIDGQVLQNIEILVKDAVTGKPEEIKTINLYNNAESNSDCTLSFAEKVVEEIPTGIFECTSNDVVVDMTAPEVSIEKKVEVNKGYIQTLKDGENGYDYYNGEVTYIITVIDNFLTMLNKQADKSVIEVEYVVDGETHTVALQEPTEPTEPEVTEPEVSEPQTTEPEATEATEPEVTEPEETEPEVTEPEATEMLQEEDIYEGRFTVIDGQTLSAITIKVIDDAGNVAKVVEVLDADTEIDLTSEEEPAVDEETTEEPTENPTNLLTKFVYDNNAGANVYVGNNVVVDMTAPQVTLSFSENVVGYYSRENEDVVYVKLENPGNADSGLLTGQQEEFVTVTVTVKDKNIWLDPNNQYSLKNNLLEENAWTGIVGKNTDSVVIYQKNIKVESDATGFFAIDLSVFDLASNPVELVMDNLNTTNGYIPQIQPVENGKIDATITVDRIRPGSEYEQQEDRNRPVITIESSIDPITILEDDIELYNDQLTFDLSVVDGDVNDDKNIYKNSGLQKVWWEITDEKGVVQTGVVNDTELEKGLYSVDYTIDIIIKDVIGETNSITLKIWAKDHVGNTTLYIDKFAVDNQAPRINVVYNNNSVQNEKYFKEDRIATITVTDINFNGSSMENGTGTTVYVNGQAYNVDWNPVEGGHQGTVRYDEDGDYEFSMITTDIARNTTTTSKDDSSEPDGYVVFEQGTAAPHVFTIDKTAPVIDVVYTPDAPNGTDPATGILHFAQDRDIRATITEVNFRASDVEADLGENNSLEWFSNGSTHVATDTFTEGNGYKVTIDYTDLAGNKAVKAHESPVFSVDKTKPTITVSSGPMVVNELNVVEEKLELGFQIHDEQSNLDPSGYTVKLFYMDKSLKKEEITDLNSYLTITDAGDNTDVYVNFNDLPMEKRYDGIYTVQITAKDFAQNAADVMELIYSVNRFGSTFFVEDEKTAAFLTEDVSGGIYHDKVTDNLKITEINPNKVWANAEHSYSGAAITLSVNGTSRVLEPGKDYTVKESNEQNANSDWYVYEYEIFKENFYNGDKPKDGNYDILFYSEDQANNKNTNEANEGSAIRTDANGEASGKMSFVLDSQKPIVTIIGLEDPSVQARNHIVKISVTDSTYVSIEVYVGNKLITLSDSEGTKDNSKNWLIRNADGSFSLNLISGQRREDVRVVIKDAAGNVQETTVKDVIINDNIIILFVTNTPLLLGSIIGLIALIIVIILLIKRKKKKEA